MATTKFKAGLLTASIAACMAAVPAIAEVAPVAQEAQATDFEDALKGGSVKLQFRYRFEYVEQEDNGLDVAKASTLRSRLTYQTKKYNDFTALVEVDDISVIGNEMYNSQMNDKSEYSVVADPDDTEVNQAWVAWSGLSGTTMTMGRQRINLDNERFIGGVGWRQNEQTFDAFTITNNSLKDVSVLYSYFNNINRVFGPDDDDDIGKPRADLDADTHILNVSYNGWSFGKLTGYGYWLDFDDPLKKGPETYPGNPNVSSRTVGARFDGKQVFGGDGAGTGGTTLFYTAEYATQDDMGDNETSYTADYYFLEGGVGIMGVVAKVGWELLESDDHAGVGFSTPLATLHRHNGWADMFLTTPPGGLEDTYFSLSKDILGAQVALVYHDFEADEGTPSMEDYGDEYDLSVTYKCTEKLSVLLKYANYNADDYAVDTEKAWLMLTYDL